MFLKFLFANSPNIKFKTQFQRSLGRTREKPENAVKKFLAVVASGDKAAATEMFPSVCSLLDGAVTKGVYKKNTVANKKSGLAKKLNAMA